MAREAQLGVDRRAALDAAAAPPVESVVAAVAIAGGGREQDLADLLHAAGRFAAIVAWMAAAASATFRTFSVSIAWMRDVHVTVLVAAR